MMLPDLRTQTLFAAVGHGHFGAKLHRSKDGGDTWEACAVLVFYNEINQEQEVVAEPASFGFPVVVHPRDPNVDVFIPAIKDEKRIPVGGQLVVSRDARRRAIV